MYVEFLILACVSAVAGFFYGSALVFGLSISIMYEVGNLIADKILFEEDLYHRIVGQLPQRLSMEKDARKMRVWAKKLIRKHEEWEDKKQRELPFCLSARFFLWRNMARVLGIPLLVFIGVYTVYQVSQLFLAAPSPELNVSLIDQILHISVLGSMGYALTLGILALNALRRGRPSNSQGIGLVGLFLGILLLLQRYLGLALPAMFTGIFIVYHVAVFIGVYVTLTFWTEE